MVRRDEWLHQAGADAVVPALHVQSDRFGERVEYWGGRARCLPMVLSREERVVHWPEFSLRASAHCGLSSGPGENMAVEREVHVGEPDLAGLHVLVAERGVGLVVPLLAVWALEVADLYHPDWRGCASLNPGEVGDRNVGVGRRWLGGNLGCLGAHDRRTFRGLFGIAGGGAGKRKRQRAKGADVVKFCWNHLLNRPPAKP